MAIAGLLAKRLTFSQDSRILESVCEQVNTKNAGSAKIFSSVDLNAFGVLECVASRMAGITIPAMKKKSSKAKRMNATRERAGTNLNVWLPEELMEAFEAMREETGRTKTTECIFMMKEYLTNHGHWPQRSQA